MIPNIIIHNNLCGCGSGKPMNTCGCSSLGQTADPVQTLPAPSLPCETMEAECGDPVKVGCVYFTEDMPDYNIKKGDRLTKLLNWMLQALVNAGVNPSVLPQLAAPAIQLASAVAKRLDVTITAVPNGVSYEIVVRKTLDQSLVGRFPGVAGVNYIPVLTSAISYDVQAVAKAPGYQDSVTNAWSPIVSA